MKTFRRIITVFDSTLQKTLSSLVVFVLLTMVGMSFLQVVLRNFFDSGIPWIDVVLRNLVLWVGMLGGALATRGGRQISIDLFSRLPYPKFKTALAWISGLFTILICFYMAKASQEFLLSEKEFNTMLYGSIPIWYAQLALPWGFSIIGLEVLLNLLFGNMELMEKRSDDPVSLDLPTGETERQVDDFEAEQADNRESYSDNEPGHEEEEK